MGPGPFTGLRVGIAAARAFALGRGIPVVPVVSHDAVALELLLHAALTGGLERCRRAVRRRHRRAPPRVRLHGLRRPRRRRTSGAGRRAGARPARRARRGPRAGRQRAAATPSASPRRCSRSPRRARSPPAARSAPPTPSTCARPMSRSRPGPSGSSREARMTLRAGDPRRPRRDHGARAGVVPDRRVVGRDDARRARRRRTASTSSTKRPGGSSATRGSARRAGRRMPTSRPSRSPRPRGAGDAAACSSRRCWPRHPPAACTRCSSRCAPTTPSPRRCTRRRGSPRSAGGRATTSPTTSTRS